MDCLEHFVEFKIFDGGKVRERNLSILKLEEEYKNEEEMNNSCSININI